MVKICDIYYVKNIKKEIVEFLQPYNFYENFISEVENYYNKLKKDKLI